MDMLWPCDGTHYPPKGVRGGQDGVTARHFKILADGTEQELPNIVVDKLHKGERVRGHHTSGGGYGDPLDRRPSKVLKDVLDGFETLERATSVYGVVLTGSLEQRTLAVDDVATVARRAGGRIRG